MMQLLSSRIVCRFHNFQVTLIMTEWDFFDNQQEYHPIIDADNLYEGFKAARKGSSWKGQVQSFRWNALEEIGKLQKELLLFYQNKPGGYQPREYSKFMVLERGKTRAITALKMRDRVVKHVLNDLYLIPHIRPHLIYDNGASLKGKGVSFSRGRLVAHLEKFYRETGSNEGYIMIMDFSGYYDNIDHDEAMRMINQYEPDEFARRLTEQAYDSYKVDVSYMSDKEYETALHTKFSMVEYRKAGHDNPKNGEPKGEKFLRRSLSVGDQTSQITAVAFTTPIDKLITIVNSFNHYGRYMDDLFVIAKTREELNELRIKIENEAKRMKLFLNPRKTKILKLSKTFTFMQYKYYLRENGHVVVRINPKTVTRMRRRLKRLKTRVDNGLMRFSKVEEMFRAWIANYCYMTSNKQRAQLIDLYRNLFEGSLDSWLKMRHIA